MSTLVVLAAGMGHRYGGLKQMDAVGPHGATLVDYSIFDAIRAGFDRIVFIIRPDFEFEFKKRFYGKLERHVECRIVHQKTNVSENSVREDPKRTKPWGTAHAVLATRKIVEEPFAVINADDYYGRGSFESISDHLARQLDSRAGEYAMVGYTLGNTLTEHGSVARGVCRADEELYLTGIEELTEIFKEDEGAYYLDEVGKRHTLVGDEIVSMNFWGFTPRIFAQLEAGFRSFLKHHGTDPGAEFYISSYIGDLLREGDARVKILPTRENWFGLTYPEDKHAVSDQIRGLVEAGVYPERLWE